ASVATSPPGPTALTVVPALWPPITLFTASWDDDPYSRDLAERSVRVFRRDFVPQDAGGRDSDPNKLLMSSVSITYSVGDAGPLNHAEQIAVNSFVEWHRPDRSQLLLLPTSAQRARRFVRGVYKSNPDKVKRVVVASGDSVSLNNVYRDSEVVW